MQSSVWPCVRDAIHKDPLPYAQMLTIEPDKSLKKLTNHLLILSAAKAKAYCNLKRCSELAPKTYKHYLVDSVSFSSILNINFLVIGQLNNSKLNQ